MKREWVRHVLAPDEKREWRVRPKGCGHRWLVFSPDNVVTEYVSGTIAIDVGRRMAQEAREVLLIYGSDDRVFSVEDYQLH